MEHLLLFTTAFLDSKKYKGSINLFVLLFDDNYLL